MQGDLAEQSMIDALEKIPPDKFDLVVITRGGGSRSDLACFDTYNLANNVCQFPLPVISAIGHERDTSVVDLVSHTKMKTPTAAAAFIIEKTAEFWSEITNYFEQITDKTSNILDLHVNFLDKAEKSILNSKNYVQNRLQTLQYFSEKMQWIVKDKYQKRAQQLTFVTNSLFPVALNQLKFQQQKVVMLTKAIDAYNPQHILKKGYSITLKNGKTVRKETEVVRGDEVITILSEGKVRSIIR
jgi:exodeoxyribonuclease VII large subunit